MLSHCSTVHRVTDTLHECVNGVLGSFATLMNDWQIQVKMDGVPLYLQVGGDALQRCIL